MHRGQAPDRGEFFDPHQAEALAGRMQETLDDYNPEAGSRALQAAAAAPPERIRQYALAYLAITKKITNTRSR